MKFIFFRIKENVGRKWEKDEWDKLNLGTKIGESEVSCINLRIISAFGWIDSVHEIS